MNTRGLLDQLLKSGQELLQNQSGKTSIGKSGAVVVLAVCSPVPVAEPWLPGPWAC